MAMSIRMTSGRSRCASSSASSPLAASPTTWTSCRAPRRRREVEAAAVIAYRELEQRAAAEQAQPQIARASVPHHVVDRLLRDAKASRLDVRRNFARRLGGFEVRRKTGERRLAVEMRAQRRPQAEVVELRRAQAERKLAHALERMADGLDAFLDARARLQLDLQRGQRLADVVVQIARQAPALLLLHLEQPARQGAQALLREFQGTLRAQPLGNVVDEDQARGAAAPAHQVADAFDIDRLAAPFHMAEHAAVYRPGFAAQELAERVAILGTADVLHRHREEFLARVAVQADCRLVSREKTQGLGVEYPPRQRAALEQHAIAALLGIDPVHQPLERRRKHARQRHKGGMVPLARAQPPTAGELKARCSLSLPGYRANRPGRRP